MNRKTLSMIKKVAVPDTVFVCLQEKIKLYEQDALSAPKALMLSTIGLIILFINLFLIFENKYKHTQKLTIEHFSNAMQLTSNTNLYD